MGGQTRDNKLVIKGEPKTLYFDLSENADNNSKQQISSIIKHNELLAKHTIKNEIRQLLSKISMQRIFINRENSKTNESHKFVFSLSQRLNLRNLNKHVALQNLSIYCK